MFNIYYFLVGLISYFVAELNASSIPQIKPCKVGDQECMISSAQEGVSFFVSGAMSEPLGIPVVDPMTINSVRSDEADFKLGFTNLKIFGMSNCTITDLKVDPDKNTIHLIVTCPLHAKGQYDINGTLLTFSVFGNGEIDLDAKNVNISVKVQCADNEKNGHTHWKIKSFDYSFDLLEKVHIGLTNLYDGDEERAKPMMAAIDAAGNPIVEEVGGKIIKQIITEIISWVEKYFQKVPKDKLLLA